LLEELWIFVSHIEPAGFYDRKYLTPTRLIAETVAMFGRPKSEIEMLKASVAGNAQAFGTVIGKYASLVCAITYSATGSITESEELAQEAFLRAWKSLGQLKDLDKFRPWLCRIARNTAQNWFRSQRRDVAGQGAPLEAAADKPSDEIGPVEAAMNREQQAVVHQALAQIPENLREPLVLFYREQQSTREVARQLGLSENAARQRISRGRSMLRAQVATMVETTIAHTKPGKAFKTAVIAAIAGAAAQTGTATAATTLFGLGAKIALAVASVALLAGAVWVHRQTATPDQPRMEAITSVSQAFSQAEGTARPAEADTVAPGEAPPATLAIATRGNDEPENTDPVEITEARQASSALASVTAPLEFKAQDVLCGLITDAETGQPVPNARVQITDRRIFRTRTDSNGFYSFEAVHQAGNFEISVNATTHVGIQRAGDDSVLVNLSNDRQTVRDFQLSRACMVDVWVVDPNGIGIAGATVVASSRVDASGRAPGYFADGRPTDPNGYVLLGGIPPADANYVITAWHEVNDGHERIGPRDFVRTAYGRAPGRSVIDLSDPNAIPEVTIILEEGQDVPGYVEYVDGVPADGVRLSVRPTWWHSTHTAPGIDTGDDGSVTFKHVIPGTYEIYRHVPQGNGCWTLDHIMQTQLPPSANEPLVIRIPKRSPQSLVSITGIITFGVDEPPYSVQIMADSATGDLTYAGALPEPDGTTRFAVNNLEPGTYTLTFWVQDMETEVLKDVPAPTSDLAVEMSSALNPTLTGRVLDAETGSPILRFAGRVRKLKTLRGTPHAQQNRWIQFDNPRGEFSLDTVGPGVYEVQIHGEGYAPRWSKQINTDESLEIRLHLPAGGTIAGQVIDEKGQPVDGAKVVPLCMACGATLLTKNAFVNQDGAVETAGGMFRLPHLPPGLETLRVSHPDYAPTIVGEIPVPEGESTDGVQIVLSAGAVVEGYVYDGKGRPLAGETIVFQKTSPDPRFDEGEQLASVATDSNGFYRVMHLARETLLRPPWEPAATTRGSPADGCAFCRPRNTLRPRRYAHCGWRRDPQRCDAGQYVSPAESCRPSGGPELLLLCHDGC
jgi:RNA polymerase sigma factor (sigma-70 family)